MMVRYVVTPKAKGDLGAYAEYLAKEVGLATATRFIESAFGVFDLLATQPSMGWPSGRRRIFRIAGFERMMILYRPNDSGVEILRVIHGSRRNFKQAS